MSVNKATPWFLWPFAVVWDLLALVLKITGRILAAVLGVSLMAVGIVLIISVAGAPIGIPFVILGLLLLIRSIF